MEYTVKINGKTRTLPTRTDEMDAMIDRIQHLRERLKAGEITRSQLREAQYNFVAFCIGDDLPPFDEIDVTDLEIAALEIVTAYTYPEIRAKVDTTMVAIREITNRPEFTKLARIAEAVARANETKA